MVGCSPTLWFFVMPLPLGIVRRTFMTSAGRSVQKKVATPLWKLQKPSWGSPEPLQKAIEHRGSIGVPVKKQESIGKARNIGDMSEGMAQEELGALNGKAPPNTESVSASLNRNTPPDTPVENGKGSQNAWATPGSAFDFRSDTITTPTTSMLHAIQNTTLQDDVFREDKTTNDLETHLATLTTHESALFVLSGTMGNQLAIRSHLTQIPHSVLCDYRAHVLEYEAGGIASLSQALVKGVVPENGIYLTLEDIEKNVVLGDEIHGCPTKVISLENTLGGTIMPLAEVKRISAFARENGIKIHLDGARLWNAVAEGAGGLDEYCREFDSVSLCFSKGLGAPMGSMLVGGAEFIKRARWIRKSIGGGTRQLGVLTSAARVALDETFGKGVKGEGGMLVGSHVTAKRIAEVWTGLGGKLSKPTETNMVWLNLADAGISNAGFVELAMAKGLRVLSGRLVVHYQISEDAVIRLGEVMEEIMKQKTANGASSINQKVERAYG